MVWHSYEEAIGAFLEQSSLKVSSRAKYGSVLTRFSNFLLARGCSLFSLGRPEVTFGYRELSQWLNSLGGEDGPSASTYNLGNAAVGRFVKWGLSLREERLWPMDPLPQRPEVKKQEERVIRVITAEDAEKVLNSVVSLREERGKSKDTIARDQALITLGYYAGLRLSEVVRLKMDQLFDREGPRTRVILKGKGNKERTVIIPAEALPFLVRYLEAERVGIGESEWVFPSPHDAGKHLHTTTVQKMFREVCEYAHLKVHNYHALRHGHATRFISQGLETAKAMGISEQVVKEARISALQQQLGHSWRKTTERYVHVVTEQEQELFDEAFSGVASVPTTEEA